MSANGASTATANAERTALEARLDRLEAEVAYLRKQRDPSREGAPSPMVSVKDVVLEFGNDASIIREPTIKEKYRDRSCVMICPTRGTIACEVVSSMKNLVAPMNQKFNGPMFAPGYEVAAAYNALIDGILDHPFLGKWKFLVTYEDDMLVPFDGLLRILETIERGPNDDGKPEWDACGALYHTKDSTHQPMAYGDAAERHRTGYANYYPVDLSAVPPCKEWPCEDDACHNHVVEVNGVAQGFTVWQMSLFRRMREAGVKSFFQTVNDKILVDGELVRPKDADGMIELEPGKGYKKLVTQDLAFCFPPGTWVYGKRVHKIEEVKQGRRVIGHTGSVHSVENKQIRRYAGRMVRVIPYYGLSVEATPEHPFLVKVKQSDHEKMQDGSIERDMSVGGSIERALSVCGSTVVPRTSGATWVPAGSIKKGDWLYVPKPKARYSSRKYWHLNHYINTKNLSRDEMGHLGYSRTRKSALKVADKIKVTPGLCRLLGYYIAEGSACGSSTGDKQVVSFAFGYHEPDVVEDCIALFKESFPGAVPTVTKTEPGQGGVTKVAFSSKVLGRLFSALCGNGAKNKHFPRDWFSLDDECLVQLLKGYWLGDGTYDDIRKINGFRFSTVSEKLAHEVRFALLRLGIISAIYEGVTEQGKDKFTIKTPISMISRFAKLVGVEGAIESEHPVWLRETKNYFKIKVRKVEEYIYDGDVHNMEVGITHSYTANGFAVHNCDAAISKVGARFCVDTRCVCGHLDTSTGRVW